MNSNPCSPTPADIASARQKLANCLPALSPDANDDTTEALAMAHANYELISRNGLRWCQCHKSQTPFPLCERIPPAQVFWRNNSSGSHGWACPQCRGITQLG